MTTAMRSARTRIIGPILVLAALVVSSDCTNLVASSLLGAPFVAVIGGAALVSVLGCTFFTSFTGAAGVTIVTLGGLVMPLLLGSGYRQRPALGLVTAAGLPGVLLMPALPPILYAIVWGVSLPLVAVLTLASGVATPVEAAAVAALYAFVITTIIRRDLDIVRGLPRVIAECGLTIRGILLYGDRGAGAADRANAKKYTTTPR